MRRRYLAAMIDALLGILALALIVGAGAGVAALRGERTRVFEGSLGRIIGSARARLAIELCLPLLAVLLTGRRSPGYRAMSIRLVDARTGGPVRGRQAVIRVGVRHAWRVPTRRRGAQNRENAPQALAELRQEIEALRREHAGDQEALQTAILGVYRENRQELTVRLSCLPALIRSLVSAAIDAPILFSPMNQGLPDMLAGTVVIIDR